MKQLQSFKGIKAKSRASARTTAGCYAPLVRSSTISPSPDQLNVHGRNLGTETLACQSAVYSLEVAQNLQLRGMIEVERQNIEYSTGRSYSLWSSKSTDGSVHMLISRKKRLPSCKLAAISFGIVPSPRRMREMKISPSSAGVDANGRTSSRIL